jgi:hypothetical protein
MAREWLNMRKSKEMKETPMILNHWGFLYTLNLDINA